MSNKEWVVLIVEEGGEVVETIECKGRREAEQVQRGVNINLNHDKFFTRCISLEKYKKEQEECF